MNIELSLKTRIDIYDINGELLYSTKNTFISAGIDWWCQMIASNGTNSHNPPNIMYASLNGGVNRLEDTSLANEESSYSAIINEGFSRWFIKEADETYGGQDKLSVHFGGYFSHDTLIDISRIGLAYMTSSSPLQGTKYTGATVDFTNSGNDIFVDYIFDISITNGYNYIQDQFWENLGKSCIELGRMYIDYFYYYDGSAWVSSGNIVSRTYSRYYIDRQDDRGYNTFYEAISVDTWNTVFIGFEVEDSSGNSLLKTTTMDPMERQNLVEFVNIVTYFST